MTRTRCCAVFHRYAMHICHLHELHACLRGKYLEGMQQKGMLVRAMSIAHLRVRYGRHHAAATRIFHSILPLPRLGLDNLINACMHVQAWTGRQWRLSWTCMGSWTTLHRYPPPTLRSRSETCIYYAMKFQLVHSFFTHSCVAISSLIYCKGQHN